MLDNKNDRTELEQLGEFGLIKHLTENFSITCDNTIKGVGDDAAVIKNTDEVTLVTTDMLIEGVHFDLSYTPLKHLGYKMAVVNISDILSMNAIPTQLTVSIAVSNRFSLEALEELYSGLQLACNNYKVDLVGGDTTSSLSGLCISVTALGQAKKADVVYREGAKNNDLICISGDLGGAYMGLQLLEREKSVFKEDPNIQPDLGGNDYILERQLKPEARMDVILKLKELGVKPTAMIDISDGLSSDLLHICSNSKVGCGLYDEKIPIDSVTFNAAIDFNLVPSVCALNGGEDYELLFTVDLADHDKIKDMKEISIVGHITDEQSGCNLITKSNESHPLEAQGWNALTN